MVGGERDTKTVCTATLLLYTAKTRNKADREASRAISQCCDKNSDFHSKYVAKHGNKLEPSHNAETILLISQGSMPSQKLRHARASMAKVGIKRCDVSPRLIVRFPILLRSTKVPMDRSEMGQARSHVWEHNTTPAAPVLPWTGSKRRSARSDSRVLSFFWHDVVDLSAPVMHGGVVVPCDIPRIQNRPTRLAEVTGAWSSLRRWR